MAFGGAVAAVVFFVIGMIAWGSVLIVAGAKSLHFAADVEDERNEQEIYLRRWTRFVAIMTILSGVGFLFTTLPLGAAIFAAANAK